MSVAVQFTSGPVIPRRGASSVRIGDAIGALLKAKTSANYSPRYVNTLRQYLVQFARSRESWPMEAFTVETVEQWFDERGEPFAVRASNTGRLSALFGFAVRRGWIERNPCDLLEKIRVRQKPPSILSPNQCALLMDYARRRKPHQLAFYALALFAGIRPEELKGIGWNAVDLDSGTVTVDAATSKIRRRRIVQLESETIRWLWFARQKGGRLPVKLITRRRYIRQASKVLGFTGWPQDILRHSAASYLLARHQDAGKVANMLGNSARVLETSYKALVNQRECAEFWSFTPDSPRPKKPKPKLPFQPIPVPTIDPTWTLFARAEAAITIEPNLRAQARRAGIDTQTELARIAGVGRSTIPFVRFILRHADPDVLDRVRKGKASIHGTYKWVLADVST